VTHQHDVHRRINGRRRGGTSNLQVDDLVLKPAVTSVSVTTSLALYTGEDQPFSKSSHTVSQLAFRFEFGVRGGDNVDIGQRMADERSEVFGKACKGVIATLKNEISSHLRTYVLVLLRQSISAHRDLDLP
jgi:hypothetical protein